MHVQILLQYRTFARLPQPLKSIICSAFTPLAWGSSQLFLALPAGFPNPEFWYLCGCFMLSCPNFQGAKPGHNYFHQCPNFLHSPEVILKSVQGPCTALLEFIKWAIQASTYGHYFQP